MKKFVLLSLLLLFPVSVASADMKIAVIDLSKAFDSYYKTTQARDRIKQKEDGYQKDIQDMKVDYDHMMEEAQKLKDATNDPTLSPAAKADKSKALEAKVQDLRNMEQKLQETSNERNRELTDEIGRLHKDIVDEIDKLVIAYSGPQGFDLVIDKSSSSSTGVPIVLYNSAKLTDITDAIIAKLNAAAPPASAKPGVFNAPAPSGSGTPAGP